MSDAPSPVLGRVRPTFVYRLDVTLPEGADAPGWHPEGWVPQEWDDEDGHYTQEFRWPRRERCLSRSTAERWKQRLEGWGAKVVIERSEPVVWTEQSDDARTVES